MNQPIEEKWKIEVREMESHHCCGGDFCYGHTDDVEEAIYFIENLLEQERRAFGGCLKCYGKGYSTEHVGETTAFADFGDEFGGDDRKVIAHSMIRMIPCNCERGKQIETLSLTSKYAKTKSQL